MARGLVIGVVGVIALVVVAVVFVFSSLDDLVKEAVETAGSEVTGVSVTLDGASVSPTDGKGSLKGLTVGNPSGFETDYAFSLGAVSVNIDTATVTSDPVVIKEVMINGPKVTYELGSGGSNVDAIQKNVDNFIKKHGGGSGDSSSSDDEGEGPKLVIENLYIKGGEISVSATMLGGKKMTTPLPDIHLQDIGKESDGAGAGEIASKIMDSLTSGAGSAVGALNLDALKDVAGEVAKEGADAAKKVLEQGTGSAGDALKDAGGKIKGLLGD